MIKEIIPNTKYKVGMNLISRKEREKMYFIKLDGINNKKFEERKIRREKIQKMWKQPKGINDNIRMYEKSKITMYKHVFFFVYFIYWRYTKNAKINNSIKDIKRNEFKTKLFSTS